MKTNKLLLTTLILSAILILYTSCKKSEDNRTLNVEKIHTYSNTLRLSKLEEIPTTINQLKNMNADQIESWEKQKGFVSLRHYQNELLKKIESMTECTQEEWNQLGKEYSDIAYFDEMGKFKPKFANPSMARLVNRNGELYIGKALIYFGEDKVISIVDGDKEKLKSAKKGNIINSENEFISSIKVENQHIRTKVQAISSVGVSSWQASDYKLKKGKQKYRGTCTLRYTSQIINVSSTNLQGQMLINVDVIITSEYRPGAGFGTWWAYNSNNSLSYNGYFKSAISSFPSPIFFSGQYIPHSSSYWSYPLMSYAEGPVFGGFARPFEVSCSVNASSSTQLGNLNYAL